MAISHQVIACGAVAAIGVILFAMPSPAELVAQGSPSPSVVSGSGITLHSVSVELPVGDLHFPGGAPADVLTNNCTACHSPDMVLYQPALTRTQWQAEIEHMQKDFKAPIVAADVPAIVAYLTSIKGAT
jgi:hypothetical protein